jgi:type I restriction enzyme R subunit
MAKEAKARILINDLLRRSGWRFFDDDTGPANVSLVVHVKLKKKTLDDFGEDFEKTANGYVD